MQEVCNIFIVTPYLLTTTFFGRFIQSYWHMQRLLKRVSHTLPIAVTRPNTEPLSAVLQFHLLFRNWYWHSSMPSLAPSPMGPMWSWYNWQSFCCPGERPGNSLHKGWVPSMKSSGFWKALNCCMRGSTPKFLGEKNNRNLFYQTFSNVRLRIILLNSMWFVIVDDAMLNLIPKGRTRDLLDLHITPTLT